MELVILFFLSIAQLTSSPAKLEEAVKPVLKTKKTFEIPPGFLNKDLISPLIFILDINEKGYVTKIIVKEEPVKGIGKAIQNKIKTLVFVPAKFKGKNVPSRIFFPVIFDKNSNFTKNKPDIIKPTSNDNSHEKQKQKRNITRIPIKKITQVKISHKKTVLKSKQQAKSNKKKKVLKRKSKKPITYKTKVIGLFSLTASSDQKIRNTDFMLFPRKTPSDLLLMVPQLHISQHSGSGKGHQIFLRGFDAEHGQDLYIGFDGVPLNEPSHVHGIGYTDLHFIIPELISSIEVLKGPYDVKYGNFATAGSINFNMKNTLLYPTTEIEIGSFNTVKITKTHYARVNSLDIVAGVQQFHTDGYTANSKWNGLRSMGRISKRLDHGGFFSTTFLFYNSTWKSSDVVPLRLFQAGTVGFYDGLDPSDGGSSTRALLTANYKKRYDNSKFISNIWFMGRETRIFTNYTWYLKDSVHGDQSEQSDKRFSYGGRIEQSKKFKLGIGKFSISTGMVFRGDELAINVFRTQSRVRWDQALSVKGKILDSGIFLRLGYQPSKKFRIVTGIRSEYFWYNASGVEDISKPSGAIDEDQPIYGTTDRKAVCPKLNFIYSPLKNLHFFLNGGSGFHSIDFRDAIQNSSRQIPIAWASELGFRTKLWKKVDFAGSFWGTYLDSEIFFDPTLGKSVDTGSSRRYGIEYEIRFTPLKWLRFHLDGSYTDARLIASGTAVPNSPKWLLNGGLTIHRVFRTTRFSWLDNTRYALGIRTRYIGRRDLALNHHSDPALITDLLIAIMLHKLDVELSIDNLFNSQWKDAQYYYNSRVNLSEPDIGVYGYHFTAGTPFAIRVNIKFHI